MKNILSFWGITLFSKCIYSEIRQTTGLGVLKLVQCNKNTEVYLSVNPQRLKKVNLKRYGKIFQP